MGDALSVAKPFRGSPRGASYRASGAALNLNAGVSCPPEAAGIAPDPEPEGTWTRPPAPAREPTVDQQVGR